MICLRVMEFLWLLLLLWLECLSSFPNVWGQGRSATLGNLLLSLGFNTLTPLNMSFINPSLFVFCLIRARILHYSGKIKEIDRRGCSGVFCQILFHFQPSRPKWRQNPCGPKQLLPPPSLPSLPTSDQPQHQRKHILSQSASNWYRWALGTQSVVLVLSKMRAKHNSLQCATLWDTTGYLQPDNQSGSGCGILSFK